MWEKIKRGRDVNNYMWGFWECSWIALPVFQISLLQLFSSSLPLFHLLRAWTVELVSFPSCLQIKTSPLSKHFLYFKNKIYRKNTLVDPVGIDFRFLRMTHNKLLAPLWIFFGNINTDQKCHVYTLGSYAFKVSTGYLIFSYYFITNIFGKPNKILLIYTNTQGWKRYEGGNYLIN